MRIVRNAAIGLAALALTGTGVAFAQSQSSDQSNQPQTEGSTTDMVPGGTRDRPATPMGDAGGSSEINTPDGSVLGQGSKVDAKDEAKAKAKQEQQSGAYGQSSGQEGSPSEEKAETPQQEKAEQSGGFGQQQQQKPDKAAKEFIDKTAKSNMQEIEVSRLAEQKAENPAVRDLARQLVRSHEQLSTKLQDVAQNVGVTVPQAQAEQSDQQKKLAKESGAQFDKKYISWVVDEHKKDVDSFQKESQKQNANPQVKSFAESTLPELRHHLMRAEAVQQQIKSEGQGSKQESQGESGGFGSEKSGSSQQQSGSSEQSGSSGSEQSGGYGSSSGSSGQSGSSQSGSSSSGQSGSGSQESGSGGGR